MVTFGGSAKASAVSPYISNESKGAASSEAEGESKVTAGGIEFSDKFSKPQYKNQVAIRIIKI
ncbi:MULTISPECIES: hypothetical protein [Clostridium]|uniref:Uncharacterized protein n=1 Tax=Clostridium cibarium TaxID=2762247 RepID=A0ABR8PWI2_9CLOT|nr:MULTISPECIES: hypothetical protein [Clostridium]MBD7912473.1 hypothetical protein [Clostridium cibarium]